MWGHISCLHLNTLLLCSIFLKTFSIFSETADFDDVTKFMCRHALSIIPFEHPHCIFKEIAAIESSGPSLFFACLHRLHMVSAFLANQNKTLTTLKKASFAFIENNKSELQYLSFIC